MDLGIDGKVALVTGGTGGIVTGIGLGWLANLLLRAYRPAMAARIFLQIFLPDGAYRRLADSTMTKSPAISAGPGPAC